MAFEAYRSEPPLPGQVVDAAMALLMSHALPEPGKARDAPPKKRRKTRRQRPPVMTMLPTSPRGRMMKTWPPRTRGAEAVMTRMMTIRAVMTRMKSSKRWWHRAGQRRDWGPRAGDPEATVQKTAQRPAGGCPTW